MQKTILVIEDDPEISNLLELIFTLNKFNVVGTDRGDNIFELISKHSPDLVLTDYLLPGLTGGRVCQLIKENKGTSHIPVVLMSAYQKMALSALNFRYDAYVPKPFDIDKLMKIILKLLN